MLQRVVAATGTHRAAFGEECPLLLVRHQFQRPDHAGDTGLPHQPVLAQLGPALGQIGGDLGFCALDDLLVLQDADVLQRHRRTDRVPGVRGAMRQFAALLLQHLRDAIVEHGRAQRDVAGGDALGHRHDVRLEAEVLRTEPFAGTAEAADHLVGDQQHVVLAADALDLGPVGHRRDVHADGAHDGLADEGGHALRPQFQDFLLQPARRDQAVFLLGQVAAVGEPERRIDVVDVGDRQTALLVHALHAAQAGTGHGGAVVAIVAADEDVLLRLVLHRPEMAHQAQDGVVGLGAGIDEEGMVEVARRQFGQLGRQFDGRLGGALEEAVVVGQLRHLLRRHLAQLLAAVADVDAPQAGEGIEQLVALGIPDIAALALGEDARSLLRQCGVVVERMQVVLGIELLQGEGVVLGHKGSVMSSPSPTGRGVGVRGDGVQTIQAS